MRKFSAFFILVLLSLSLCSCSTPKPTPPDISVGEMIGMCFDGHYIVVTGYDAYHISYLPEPEQLYIAMPRFFGGIFVDTWAEGGLSWYEEGAVASISFTVKVNNAGDTYEESSLHWQYNLEYGTIVYQRQAT